MRPAEISNLQIQLARPDKSLAQTVVGCGHGPSIVANDPSTLHMAELASKTQTEAESPMSVMEMVVGYDHGPSNPSLSLNDGLALASSQTSSTNSCKPLMLSH